MKYKLRAVEELCGSSVLHVRRMQAMHGPLWEGKLDSTVSGTFTSVADLYVCVFFVEEVEKLRIKRSQARKRKIYVIERPNSPYRLWLKLAPGTQVVSGNISVDKYGYGRGDEYVYEFGCGDGYGYGRGYGNRTGNGRSR